MSGVEGMVINHDEQKPHCTLYVLRTCSDDPVIKKRREEVFKFVITNGDIDAITINALFEPDWLLSQVEEVAAFRFEDTSAAQLQEDFIEILEPEVCDISINDGDGHSVQPLGWFKTSLSEIEMTVEWLQSEAWTMNDGNDCDQHRTGGAFNFTNDDFKDDPIDFEIESDEGRAIDLDNFVYGSPLYRLASFRLWLQPKPMWVQILVWLMVVAVVCLLTAIAVSLFYVIAGLAILAVLGWIASLNKK